MLGRIAGRILSFLPPGPFVLVRRLAGRYHDSAFAPSLLRVAPQALQQSALGDSLRRIEAKQPHCGGTDVGNRFNRGTFKPEMIAPKVTSRIEEPCDRARALIYRGNVSAFVPITGHTGIRQIIGGRFTTLLATDNVIDLMREARFQLMDEAILATFTRAPSYFRS